MIKIIGDGVIPEARAFDRVAESLEFDEDIYLAAMWAGLVNCPIPDGSVIYNMEPLGDDCRSFTLGYFDTLKRCRVLDYDRANVEYLKTKGVDAFYLPYGYHESLERVVERDKTIDILFVGSINPRRVALISRLRERFNVVWATGAYGVALDELISISKVHLNLHYSDEHPLEVVRLNYLMANHCTVVSEPGIDEEMNAAYQKGIYISHDIERLCECALDRPLDGYETIKSMTMDCTQANNWIKEN